jgi:predicted DNA repair protein MutK
MALILSEVYEALRAAQVPDAVAKDAAHALGEMTAEVRLLKWMVGTFGVVLVGMIAGIYVVLFNVVGRLPR